MATISNSTARRCSRPRKPELKPPPLYKVMLLNDDYTPMDFVVSCCRLFSR